MLLPERMTRVVIIGERDELRDVVERLHSLNLLHINDFTEEDPVFRIGEPFEEASRYSEYLLRLRSLVRSLGVRELYEKYDVREIEEVLSSKLDELSEEISRNLEMKSKIESEIREVEQLMLDLRPFEILGIRPSLCRGYEGISCFVGRVRKFEEIREALSDIADQIYFVEGEREKERYVAVFAPRDIEGEVSERLLKTSFSEIPVPPVDGETSEEIKKASERLEELRKEAEELERRIEELKEKYAGMLLACEEYLAIEVEKAEAPLRFATSDNFFVIDGWVPSERIEELYSSLQDFRLHITEVSSMEEPPVSLKHSKPISPFKLLIDIFSTPRYNEIDPTLLIFITFPIFYGFMLGDVGYGLLIAIMSLMIKRKMKGESWQSLASIGLYSAILSIIFGLIYGEFFGFPIYGEESIFGLTHFHAPLHRFHEVVELLMISLIIGVTHISLGLFIGLRNAAALHGWREAIYGKLCWILMLFGGILIVYGLLPPLMRGIPVAQLNFFSPLILLGVILLIAGVLLLVIGEGPIMIMEIPTLLSNVISYSRLLAIGLSSVGIALAVNTISFELFISKGGFFLLLGALVLLFGHSLNLALGIIGPGLHSLRLHYVEFFTKFFEGGGKKYSPFGRIRKYLKEG
ncbi:MAG: V-type ATP synthase subunit I [Archaeoglobi archaeon]|nr:V-type ATP synthase subunit I [Candidatus Mnemosynella bozhongmuii]